MTNSRRTFLSTSVAIAAVAATANVASAAPATADHDPIFTAIEDHRTKRQAYCDYCASEDAEDDDATNASTLLNRAADMAARDMLSTEIRTLPGLLAFVAYVVERERECSVFPETLDLPGLPSHYPESGMYFPDFAGHALEKIAGALPRLSGLTKPVAPTLAPVEPDPIFAAMAARTAAHSVAVRNLDADEPFADADAAAEELLSITPTTIPGLLAMMRHVIVMDEGEVPGDDDYPATCIQGVPPRVDYQTAMLSHSVSTLEALLITGRANV